MHVAVRARGGGAVGMVFAGAAVVIVVSMVGAARGAEQARKIQAAPARAPALPLSQRTHPY